MEHFPTTHSRTCCLPDKGDSINAAIDNSVCEVYGSFPLVNLITYLYYPYRVRGKQTANGFSQLTCVRPVTFHPSIARDFYARITPFCKDSTPPAYPLLHYAQTILDRPPWTGCACPGNRTETHIAADAAVQLLSNDGDSAPCYKHEGVHAAVA